MPTQWTSQLWYVFKKLSRPRTWNPNKQSQRRRMWWTDNDKTYRGNYRVYSSNFSLSLMPDQNTVQVNTLLVHQEENTSFTYNKRKKKWEQRKQSWRCSAVIKLHHKKDILRIKWRHESAAVHLFSRASKYNSSSYSESRHCCAVRGATPLPVVLSACSQLDLSD